MKKISLIAVVILISCTQNRAPAEFSSGGTTGDFSVPRPPARPANIGTVQRVSTKGSYWRPSGIRPTNTTFNSLCNNFIRRDGSYGPWGREMVQAMREVQRSKGRPIFTGNSSSMVQVGGRCKSTEYFQSLSREQQEHIWVWFWAAVAQAESSCRPHVKVNGIWNNRFGRFNKADGLFQLEYETETRRANGRSRAFCPSNTNTQAIRYQMRCAASTMADTQAGRFLMDTTPGRRRYSYWEKLKHPNGQIFSLLRLHPLCR